MRRAVEMAKEIDSTFEDHLRRARAKLPIDDADHRMALFNYFMDGLVGAIVMVGTTHVREGSDASFEEAVIANLKQKYQSFRQVQLAEKLGVARDLVNIPTEGKLPN